MTSQCNLPSGQDVQKAGPAHLLWGGLIVALWGCRCEGRARGGLSRF